jgi:hypothetical protein
MTYLTISNKDSGIEDFGPQEWVDFWRMVDLNMTGEHLYSGNKKLAAEIDALIADRRRVLDAANKMCKLVPTTSAKTKAGFGLAMDKINREIHKIMGNRVSLNL